MINVMVRFSGVLLSSRLRPAILILLSLTGCVLSTLLLVVTGDKVSISFNRMLLNQNNLLIDR